MRTQSVMCCGTATKQLLNTCTQTRTSLPSRLGSTSSLGSHESPSPYANLKAPPPKPSVAMPQPSMANTVHEPAKPKPLVPKRLKAPPPVVLPKPVFPPAMPPPVKSPSAPPMAAEPAQPSKKARGVDAPVSSQSTAAAPQLVMPKTAIKSPPHLPAKTETTHSQVLKRAKPLPMEDETAAVKAKPPMDASAQNMVHPSSKSIPQPLSTSKSGPMQPSVPVSKATIPSPAMASGGTPPGPKQPSHMIPPNQSPVIRPSARKPTPTYKRENHASVEALQALCQLRTQKGLNNPALPAEPKGDGDLDDIYEALCRETAFTKQDIQAPLADKIFMRGTTDHFSGIWADDDEKVVSAPTGTPVATPARCKGGPPMPTGTPPTPSTKAPSPISTVCVIDLDALDDDDTGAGDMPNGSPKTKEETPEHMETPPATALAVVPAHTHESATTEPAGSCTTKPKSESAIDTPPAVAPTIPPGEPPAAAPAPGVPKAPAASPAPPPAAPAAPTVAVTSPTPPAPAPARTPTAPVASPTSTTPATSPTPTAPMVTPTRHVSFAPDTARPGILRKPGASEVPPTFEVTTGEVTCRHIRIWNLYSTCVSTMLCSQG